MTFFLKSTAVHNCFFLFQAALNQQVRDVISSERFCNREFVPFLTGDGKAMLSFNAKAEQGFLPLLFHQI